MARRTLRAEQLAGGVGAFHQQQQAVAQDLRVASPHGLGHLGQHGAEVVLVLEGGGAGGMGWVGVLDHRVGDPAAAIARLDGAGLQIADPGADLRLRVAGVVGDHPLETVEEIAAVVAQIGGGQFVLRAEGAIEAGLGDACLGDDLIDPHRADALPVKQVAGGLPDSIGGPLGRRSRVGHACLLTM